MSVKCVSKYTKKSVFSFSTNKKQELRQKYVHKKILLKITVGI